MKSSLKQLGNDYINLYFGMVIAKKISFGMKIVLGGKKKEADAILKSYTRSDYRF